MGCKTRALQAHLFKCCVVSGDVEAYAVTPRTKLKRYPGRGAYDKQTVHAILDEGFICHIGYVVDGQPLVTPTAYARVEETLYFHGNISNRMLKTLKVGAVSASMEAVLEFYLCPPQQKLHAFSSSGDDTFTLRLHLLLRTLHLLLRTWHGYCRSILQGI